MLLGRAREAAELIGKDTEPSRLRCHPDDLALLENAELEIEVAADAALSRGTLVLEMHESHAEPLPALCRAAGFATAEARKDLAGLWRFVVARRAP